VQEIAVLVAVFRLAAGDHQQVLARDDVDLALLEAGHGKRDPVAVVRQLLDIVRRVIVAGLGAGGAFEIVEEPVEADGGTTIRGKIKRVSHVQCPPLSNM
jgi:hypothetical protein